MPNHAHALHARIAVHTKDFVGDGIYVRDPYSIREILPVVRYRTGDFTRLLPGSITAMRRMPKIAGRTDDMLIIRGVNVFLSESKS